MEPATPKNRAYPLQVVQLQLSSPKIHKMLNAIEIIFQELGELP